MRKARREERAVQSDLFKGRLFRPGPPPAEPAAALSMQQPLWGRLWAYLGSLFRMLFPATIWQREQERT